MITFFLKGQQVVLPECLGDDRLIVWLEDTQNDCNYTAKSDGGKMGLEELSAPNISTL